MKTIGKILASLVLLSAKTAACATSSWNSYQSKEPVNLQKKEVKKQNADDKKVICIFPFPFVDSPINL